MNTRPADAYRARFRAVLAHIDAHLNEPLSVEGLSVVAALSKYYFHRQFAALFGVGVTEYLRLARLKRAAYQLAFRKDLPVTDIALESGYENPESFSRAFKRLVGQSPSAFRVLPSWSTWHELYRAFTELRSLPMNTPETGAVDIVAFPQTRVALLEHRGDPRRLGESIARFIAWRRDNRLPPSRSATYNLLYDDPADTAPEDYRFGLCAATESEVGENAYGVVAGSLPGGRCARLRHVGPDEGLGERVRYLYGQWLPQSGQVLRDFPIVLQRLRFFPDVAEHEAVTDIFLPLA